jgi:hypothetical protein
MRQQFVKHENASYELERQADNEQFAGEFPTFQFEKRAEEDEDKAGQKNQQSIFQFHGKQILNKKRRQKGARRYEDWGFFTAGKFT